MVPNISINMNNCNIPSVSEVIVENTNSVLAVPGEAFGGPVNSYFLCTYDNGNLSPIDNVPLFLNSHYQLPSKEPEIKCESNVVTSNDEAECESNTDTLNNERVISLQGSLIVQDDEEGLSQLIEGGNEIILRTKDVQHIDQQRLLTLTNDLESANLAADGQLILTPGNILAESEQIVLFSENNEQLTSNSDIITVTLVRAEDYQNQLLEINNENVFQIDGNNEIQIVEQQMINLPPINPPVRIAKTKETSILLTQPPIMSTCESPPIKKKIKSIDNENGITEKSLEDCLAAISMQSESSTVPSSLNLPITITNPALAPNNSSNPITLGAIYPLSALINTNQISPNLLTISAINGNQEELITVDYEEDGCSDNRVIQQTNDDEIVVVDYNHAITGGMPNIHELVITTSEREVADEINGTFKQT